MVLITKTKYPHQNGYFDHSGPYRNAPSPYKEWPVRLNALRGFDSRGAASRALSLTLQYLNSLKERQQKLENERQAIRQQLESGVETMYAEALKLYKSGNYQAAATRFSDIQDLIPNYKNTDQYLKALKEPSTAKSKPVIAEISTKEEQQQKREGLQNKNLHQQEIENVFQQAMLLFRNEKYAEAKEAFAEL